MAMSLDDLRAFVAAADLGSVARAATALELTPSALSKRLKSLEAYAGVELLARSTAGIELTAAGRALLPDARRAIAQVDAVAERLRGLATDVEPVRMAASPGIAERIVPVALSLLDGERALPVELQVANSSIVRQMVLDGRADLGVAAADLDENLAHLGRVLAEDELVAVVPEGHPWMNAPAVDVAELAATRLILRDPASHIRRTLEWGIATTGRALAVPLVEVGNAAAVKAAIRARGVPGVLSRFAVDPELDRLAVRPIVGARLRRRYWVLVAPGAGPETTRVADGLFAAVQE
ncbi:MAG: LysR family transcriptional regulator [Solirubrobacteraceae bacterium]|nr:LysR family transcriptional regulator [Solirubrobacteraceae bacterium]